jgi:serine/threonine-protein kinase
MISFDAGRTQLSYGGAGSRAAFGSEPDRELSEFSEYSEFSEFPDDVSAGSLLREVARIDDVAPPVGDPAHAGELIGEYRIVRQLGRGATGVVYEAEDLERSRRVALKVLAVSRGGDPDRRRRFLREARAAVAVVHPNVAAAYYAGYDRGLDYLAMELIAGETLREAMRRRAAPFEVAEATRIGEAIAAGVGTAHRLGIVHRDLKPENVMITDDGTVKVLDFGLAKLVPPPGESDDPPASFASTFEGHILGTPAYMSPEQSQGRAVDARSDVFALGVVLYELVTARRPFSGKSAIELFVAIEREEPVAPAERNPRVPPALAAIVMRCLCKSPQDRFASCGDVAGALAGLDLNLGALAPISARRDRARPV